MIWNMGTVAFATAYRKLSDCTGHMNIEYVEDMVLELIP